MSVREPTPQDAQTAVVEAERALASMRAQDRIFAVRLLALAATVIALSIVIVVLSSLPAWLGPALGVVAGVAIALAVVVVVAAERRQHAFTRAGNRLFIAVLVVWFVWAEFVWQAATHSDWLAYSLPRPQRALHFVLTAVIGVVPLVGGAVVFRLRR